MRAGPAGIRAAPRRAGRDHLRRERRTALLVRRRPRPRARLALRGRQRARHLLAHFKTDTLAGFDVEDMPAGVCAPARCCAMPRAQSQALAHAEPVGRAPRPVRAAGPGHAPQPGTDPDPVGRTRPRCSRCWTAAAYGQPAAAALAASPAARERAGAGAPARHLGPAGRPHGRGTDLRRRRLLETLRATLNAFPDIERIAARLALRSVRRASWPACATRCTRCPRCASWSPHVVLAAPGRAAGPTVRRPRPGRPADPRHRARAGRGHPRRRRAGGGLRCRTGRAARPPTAATSCCSWKPANASAPASATCAWSSTASTVSISK